jgi:hypothetical protein
VPEVVQRAPQPPAPQQQQQQQHRDGARPHAAMVGGDLSNGSGGCQEGPHVSGGVAPSPAGQAPLQLGSASPPSGGPPPSSCQYINISGCV